MQEALLLKKQPGDILRGIEESLVEINHKAQKLLPVMLESLRLHDQVTYEHSLRVARKAKTVAQKLFPDHLKLQDEFFLAGLIHDIGKITVDRKVLEEPNRDLTQDKWQILYSHSRCGFKLINDVLGLPRIATIALGHHGEPRNGERRQRDLRIVSDRRSNSDRRQQPADPELFGYARILTIIDQEDALLDHSRPYKSHELWVIRPEAARALNNEQERPAFSVQEILYKKYPNQKEIID